MHKHTIWTLKTVPDSKGGYSLLLYERYRQKGKATEPVNSNTLSNAENECRTVLLPCMDWVILF